ncbi:MAG: class I SAM-dependent methyltransferase [Actinomycetota bacterium]|nr:class I SAM-dependent methyltransferase [Actinomycetota bacterium]
MSENPQVKVWNDTVGGAWTTHAEHFDTQLQPFGDAVLDRLAVQPHERVVDVGCGTGATTVDLGGLAQEVLGVDLSVPMLAMARQRVAAVRATNVNFAEVDVQAAPFTDTQFDVAFSRFGVMFFSDPVRAFTHIRQSLIPGGRLGFVCFGDVGDNPFMLVPVMAAAAHLPMPPMPGPTAPGPFSLADVDRTTGILAAAGFSDVTILPGPDSVTLGSADDLSAVAQRTVEQNPMSGAGMMAATPAARAAAVAAAAEALAAHVAHDNVVLAARTWVVTATA